MKPFSHEADPKLLSRYQLNRAVALFLFFLPKADMASHKPWSGINKVVL